MGRALFNSGYPALGIVGIRSGVTHLIDSSVTTFSDNPLGAPFCGHGLVRLAASNDSPQALDGLLAPVVTPGAFFLLRGVIGAQTPPSVHFILTFACRAVRWIPIERLIVRMGAGTTKDELISIGRRLGYPRNGVDASRTTDVLDNDLLAQKL
jgi:hypothetical protein